MFRSKHRRQDMADSISASLERKDGRLLDDGTAGESALGAGKSSGKWLAWVTMAGFAAIPIIILLYVLYH